MKQQQMRNFSIIAHIDHGKSTLADRIIDACSSTTPREKKTQLLDDMDLEIERGITIKLNAVDLQYNYNNELYHLHLIDTPGHVDFTYEVSRSLAACEGALLIVDAAQGIEAQTLANFYLALEEDLVIIPVINKIDLPNADPEKVKNELVKEFGFKEEDIVLTSAKTGVGIDNLIKAIIEKIPAPKGDLNKPLQGLIFDSEYDPYKGVLISTRIVNGKIKLKDEIKLMKTNATYEVVGLSVYAPHEKLVNELITGEVGVISASIKDIKDVKVGDTITLKNNPALEPLPGYQVLKPMVYSGFFPLESSKFEDLREALGKLALNDASLVYEPETSTALGFGFRVGFLGLLHLEIIQERIEREYKIDLIATAPSVVYQLETTKGEIIEVDSPSKMLKKEQINTIKEPYVLSKIFTPSDYIGPVMELNQEKRGIYLNMVYLDTTRVQITYEIPLSEIIYDYFDRLKSVTKGYASFDYEPIGLRESNLVKMDILINGEVVDALSVVLHKDNAYSRGKEIVEKLKKIIPRQMFEIPIQAAIGTSIIARGDIKALRKNVLAKCYGGDVSRKKKLLEKQKEGKKRMKMIGSVEVPQEAFLSVLSKE